MVVSWIALVVSILSVGLSAGFTWVNLRDRRRSERTAHVARVSVENVEQQEEATGNGGTNRGAHLVVRNDGPSAVTIGSIALAYGPKWILNEERPVYWELDFVAPRQIPRRLLPPGEELIVESLPETRTDIGVLGPVVTLVGGNGNARGGDGESSLMTPATDHRPAAICGSNGSRGGRRSTTPSFGGERERCYAILAASRGRSG
jgi:hypothetical protein